MFVSWLDADPPVGKACLLQQTLLSGRDADHPVGEACFLRQTLLSGRGLQV